MIRMNRELKYPIGTVFGNRTWNISEGYDLVSDYYDQWYWQKFWIANEFPLIRREIRKRTSSQGKYLDIGVGTGMYMMELLHQSNQSYGIDVSMGMLSNTPDSIHGRLICCQVEQIPFADDTFNLATICRVLSHVEDLEATFCELSRIVKVGGSLVFSDVSPQHNYENTRIPTPDGDVHIQTFKHSISDIQNTLTTSNKWRLEHITPVSYRDLLWRPADLEFPAIDCTSTKQIFYFGIVSRL